METLSTVFETDRNLGELDHLLWKRFVLNFLCAWKPTDYWVVDGKAHSALEMNLCAS